jgi:hypothetical protein
METDDRSVEVTEARWATNLEDGILLTVVAHPADLGYDDAEGETSPAL